MCWKCDELNEGQAKDPKVREKELKKRGASMGVYVGEMRDDPADLVENQDNSQL